VAGVTASQLTLIAASGHEAPGGAHLIITGVLIVGAAVVLAATARRRRTDKDRDPEPTERKRSER
jgi:multisubunit Na+/H+ antiporter MnhB subunit